MVLSFELGINQLFLYITKWLEVRYKVVFTSVAVCCIISIIASVKSLFDLHDSINLVIHECNSVGKTNSNYFADHKRHSPYRPRREFIILSSTQIAEPLVFAR